MYYPAIVSISDRERANVIIHNAVPHPSLLHGVAPQHRYYSWLNNDVLRYYSPRERNSLASSYDGIICCSEYIRSVTVAGLANEYHDRVHVVQNGVDLDQFDAISQNKQSKITILFIGRVVPEKGIHVLIDAVIDLNSKGYDFNVRIVGRCGFDNNDALSRYERELRVAANLCGNIEFMPFARREEVPRLMASADILVVPSIWPDPNPLVVKEGLAAGLAVVCSDIGGIPEILQDGKWLFPPGDSRALSDKLRVLICNTIVTRGLGADNRVHVQKFSWDNQFERLTRILI
jgi:glycosyltransferase involved in cell wall biosynthesis